MIKTINKYISFAVAIALLLLMPASAFAAQDSIIPSYNNGLVEANYNNNIKNPKYVTPVGNQGDEDECMFYAVTSAAGSYCLKNNIVGSSKANFSVKSLVKKVGKSTNYGKVLYGSAMTSLGSGCYITGIENLTGKGVITLKQHIKARGSVIAAINLPSGGMMDSDYYSPKNATYNYNFNENVSDNHHAFIIVGWDDDFSENNFNVKPASKGAWLCKNSYGKEYGDGGYFWLPYSYSLTYSASIEVSKFDGLVMAYRPSDSVKFGYVSAVSFISGESIADAHVTVLSGKEVILDTNSDVKNGFNFVSLDKPVKADDITVKVADKDIAVFAKYVVVNKNKVLKPSTVEVTSETKVLENVSINIGETYAYAVTNGEIEHNVYLNAVDNCYYITPCDGFNFTDETLITLTQIEKVFESEDRLSPLPDTASNIENVELLEDGRLKIKSKTFGGAYIRGIDVSTGEDGNITEVYLVYDGGQRQALKPDQYGITLWSDSEKTTRITSVADLDTYYAEVKVYKGIPDENNFNVYLNSAPDLSKELERSEGTGFTVGITIDIPEVATSIAQKLIMFFDFFLKISNIFK